MTFSSGDDKERGLHQENKRSGTPSLTKLSCGNDHHMYISILQG